MSTDTLMEEMQRIVMQASEFGQKKNHYHSAFFGLEGLGKKIF